MTNINLVATVFTVIKNQIATVIYLFIAIHMHDYYNLYRYKI